MKDKIWWVIARSISVARYMHRHKFTKMGSYTLYREDYFDRYTLRIDLGGGKYADSVLTAASVENETYQWRT